MKINRLVFLGIIGFMLIINSSFAQDNPFTAEQEKIIHEIVPEGNSYAIQQIVAIDLDNDKTNEAVVIYFYGAHSSGAKVIKFQDGKGVVMFEHETGTPVTEFDVVDNIPTITFEQSDFKPDYVSGGRFQDIYRWNGKKFELFSP